LLTVLVVLAGAGVALYVYRPGPVKGWLAGTAASPSASPGKPPPTPGAVLPKPGDSPAPTAAGVTTAIAGLTKDNRLGGHVGVAAPSTALMIDGGRPNPPALKPRAQQPDLAAAQAFAKALGLPATAAVKGVAKPGAAELGVVYSPPLSRLVERMLADSDNVMA